MNLEKEREKEVEKAPAAAKTAPQPLCSHPSIRKDSEEEAATPNSSISALFKKTAKTLGLPRPKSAAELDARRREILLQGEEMIRKYPTNGDGLGKVATV